MTLDIQSYVDQGNALAAQFVGLAYSHYRPTLNATTAALASGNLLGTLNAWFAQKGNFRAQSSPKSDEWIGYFDGSQTQPGDYLSNGTRTWFIAAQQPLLPYLAIFCERVISVFKPAGSTAVGLNSYGGNTAATQTPLLTSWPASCLTGTKGEKGDTTMPDDVKSPWWVFRLPPTPGIVIQTGNIITDDLSRQYSVSAAESTEYGWRLTVRQNVT